MRTRGVCGHGLGVDLSGESPAGLTTENAGGGASWCGGARTWSPWELWDSCPLPRPGLGRCGGRVGVSATSDLDAASAMSVEKPGCARRSRASVNIIVVFNEGTALEFLYQSRMLLVKTQKPSPLVRGGHRWTPVPRAACLSISRWALQRWDHLSPGAN